MDAISIMLPSIRFLCGSLGKIHVLSRFNQVMPRCVRCVQEPRLIVPQEGREPCGLEGVKA